MEMLQQQNNTPHEHGIAPAYYNIPNDNTTPNEVRSNERNALIKQSHNIVICE